MFKSSKKLRNLYNEFEFSDEASIYLSENDRKALQKKAKKELKRSSVKYNKLRD